MEYWLDSHMESVLWSAEQISRRVSELGVEISEQLKNKGFSPPPPIILVGVATGAFMFVADLVRAITLPVSVDFIRAESYGSGTQSNGAPSISCDVKLDVKGKHLILVEDIVDTGNTLSCLISHLESKGASSVSVCTFLDKPARRKVHFQLVGEGKFYRGFEENHQVHLPRGLSPLAKFSRLQTTNPRMPNLAQESIDHLLLNCKLS